MARPRNGIGFTQNGVVYTGVRLKDGKRWARAVLSFGSPPAGVTADERWAKIVSQQLQARYDAGRWNPEAPTETKHRQVHTVHQWCARWIETQSYASKNLDARTLDNHLRSTALGLKPLDSITRNDFREYAQYLVATKRAPRTLRNIWDVIRRGLQEAFAEGLCPVQPIMPKDSLPEIRDADREWRSNAIFSRGEIVSLLSSEQVSEDRRVLYALLALTGVRLGEVLALRWRHWDPSQRPLGRLLVASSISRHTKEEKGTKTDAPRAVPVHPALSTVLSQWRSLVAHAPTDPIVPSVDPRAKGPRRTHDAVYQGLQEDLRRLGVRPRRVHDFRRTFISLCRDDGARTEILRWVTHGGSKSSIMDVYSTLQWSTLCAEVARLDIPVSGSVTGSVTVSSSHQQPARFHAGEVAEATGFEPESMSREVVNSLEMPIPRDDAGHFETSPGRFVTGFVTDVTERAKAILAGDTSDEALNALASTLLDPDILAHAKRLLRAKGEKKVTMGVELAENIFSSSVTHIGSD